MATPLRIATFNLENLDDGPDEKPPLAARIAVLRPQLLRLRADVLCLQEVHGQEPAGGGPRTLAALDELLAATPYAAYQRATTRTQQGAPYDQRNLVVLSRFPILGSAQVRDEGAMPSYRRLTALPPVAAASKVEWERPFLHVRIDVGGGRVLHVLNLHMKSKLPSDIPGQKLNTFTWRTASGWAEGFFLASMKRVGQAIEVRRHVDALFDQDPLALIAVGGDFNADLDEVPVTAIRGPVEETGNPELGPRVLFSCENSVPAGARYSLFHLGKGCMLDHILASRGLLAAYRGAEIHNEILPDESGAFRDDTKFPESDHAPVIAAFELP
jgi:endonuclease/exonuclease/phosphatase family metal-dependent hydrolase